MVPGITSLSGAIEEKMHILHCLNRLSARPPTGIFPQPLKSAHRKYINCVGGGGWGKLQEIIAVWIKTNRGRMKQ